MSNHVLSWAWKQQLPDPVSKLILIKLADQANDDGVCWPSRDTLASECGVSVATIKRRVSVLIEEGYLSVEQRRGKGGLNQSNLYQLAVSDRGSTVTRGEDGTAGRVVTRHRGSAVTREPKLEPSLDISTIKPVDISLDEPPPIVLVDGRNIPLDALCEIGNVDQEGPRYGQAVVALNGRRGKNGQILDEGIRHLCWREAQRWARETDRGDRLDELRDDPEEWARALAVSIERKASLYRERMNGAMLSPTSLRNWWFDIEKQVSSKGRQMTDDEIAAL